MRTKFFLHDRYSRAAINRGVAALTAAAIGSGVLIVLGKEVVQPSIKAHECTEQLGRISVGPWGLDASETRKVIKARKILNNHPLNSYPSNNRIDRADRAMGEASTLSQFDEESGYAETTPGADLSIEVTATREFTDEEQSATLNDAQAVAGFISKRYNTYSPVGEPRIATDNSVDPTDKVTVSLVPKICLTDR